ncbi:hypothetical protein ABIE41_002003 [Bosea sp. OAE506]
MLQLNRQDLRLPPGQESQLIVGDDIATLLIGTEMTEPDDRNFLKASS